MDRLDVRLCIYFLREALVAPIHRTSVRLALWVSPQVIKEIVPPHKRDPPAAYVLTFEYGIVALCQFIIELLDYELIWVRDHSIFLNQVYSPEVKVFALYFFYHD
jgi:hypothetical protein